MSDYPKLVRTLVVMSGSLPAAEDAVQEALARAWEQSTRGAHIDSLPAFVTTVATNLSRSAWRRRRAEKKALREPGFHDEVVAPPDAELVALREELGRLSRRQREAVALYYYADLPVADVAKILQVSEGTVKTTLFRARAALAAALGDDEEVSEHA